MKKPLLALALVAACSLSMVGCTGTQTTATKTEEEHFRNPSKTPPADAIQSRDEALRKAAEQSASK